MTSLSEAYGGRGGSEVDPRRLYLGVGSFVVGTLLLVAGLIVAAEVVLPAGYGSGDARWLGGVLGGVGVPLLLLGVMTVLPADRNTRAAALVGAAVMCLGVALFAHAYPHQWVGGPSPELPDLTVPTAGLYILGAATTLWSVFVGVANFKTRNDPGGTVTMEVTHKGETKVVEVSRDQLDGMGGVGLLGATPDGDVSTQTNRPNASASATGQPGRTGGSGSAAGSADTGGSVGTGRSAGPATGAAGVSDGGDTASRITSPLDEPDSTASPDAPSTGDAARDAPGDAYCGSCAQFDYVRTDEGMQPYCAHYDELMDDMEACENWTPR
ncbi:hypothetical protein GJ633_04540 [Halorubrum sp. CBA1125]|uniref:DUF7139 domain-containing protein n=1 Tax=Halorubrum sp. CBA1125 TaxID=2668072 RepID=UPI0012E93AE7|nr:hypothetical protein [Halorubrum sp. CBA1125]MUW14010.1 hypothetical protein [Halorubrum sp. CBA1125]